MFVVQGLAGRLIHAHDLGGVLDDDLSLGMGMLCQERFDHFAVTHQDDGAIQFTDGQGRPFNDRLGSIIAPHGINCDLHGCLSEDFSDLFDLHDLAAAVKSTVSADPVRHLGLAAL